MLPSQQIVTSILNFSDEQFHDNIQELILERESLLLDENYFGIALNAPAQVDINSHKELPLIMAARFDGKRDWDYNLADKCILVGINLQDSSVHYEHLFISQKEKESRHGSAIIQNDPRPPESDLDGEAAQLIKLNIRNILNISWETGAWFFSAINYDWVSNSVPVTLKGNTKFLYKQPEFVIPKPNFDNSSLLPSYFPLEGTSDLKEPGIKFKIKPLISNEKVSITVSGAFIIPMRSQYKSKEKISHKFQDKGEKEVIAIVPLSCLIIPDNGDDPIQFDWVIPIYEKQVNSEKLIKGYFSINIIEEREQKKIAGNYACYIVVSDSILGPQILQVPSPT